MPGNEFSKDQNMVYLIILLTLILFRWFFCLITLPIVHRIGRTGRCGNRGTATTFINKGIGRSLFIVSVTRNQVSSYTAADSGKSNYFTSIWNRWVNLAGLETFVKRSKTEDSTFFGCHAVRKREISGYWGWEKKQWTNAATVYLWSLHLLFPFDDNIDALIRCGLVL